MAKSHDGLLRSGSSGKSKLSLALICLLVTIIIVVLLAVSIFIIVWFSLGAYLWDEAFGIDVARDCFAELRDNRPWNYTLVDNGSYCPPLYNSINETALLSPYRIVPYRVETVRFLSRDPEWVATGSGHIVGTLLLQSVVNNSSRFVIVVHGVATCRFTYASVEPGSMLYEQGFNVLMIDLRNHGDSDMYEANPYESFGLYEHRDVLGALDYLTVRYPFLNVTNSVALFGSSMGAGCSLISFALERRFKYVFADSPPCNVYRTILFGAEQVVGSLAHSIMAAGASLAPIKGTMGFPPFKLDPEQLMKTVNFTQSGSLAPNRKIFLFQTSGDYVVPQFNQNLCRDAIQSSAYNQGLNPDDFLKTYLDNVTYPSDTGARSSSYCMNHLVSMFYNSTKYYSILQDFFKDMN